MAQEIPKQIPPFLFTIFDELKEILEKRLLSRILTEYTKNEIFSLFYLYRNQTSNMSDIARYLNAPLNTATGVISRLEKKGAVVRQRPAEDRRIVEISLTDYGLSEINTAIHQILEMGDIVFSSFDEDEKQMLMHLTNKAISAIRLSAEGNNNKPSPKKVRKIKIE